MVVELKGFSLSVVMLIVSHAYMYSFVEFIALGEVNVNSMRLLVIDGGFGGCYYY